MRLLPFLLISIFALPLPAQLLVRETFDYAHLNPIFCLGEPVNGWTGPWERLVGDYATIRRGNLGDDESTARRPGRAVLDFVRAGMRYERKLERIQDDGDVLWLSYDVDFGPTPAADNVGNITLTRANQQVFTVGRKFGNRKIGLVWPGVTGYDTDVDAEGEHRLVVKIQFSGDTGEEQAWLWVDPELEEGQSPDEALADLTVPSNGLPGVPLNIGFDGVQMKVEGTPPLRVGFDNIFLGRTYTDVSPDLTSTRTPAFQALPLTVYPNPTDGPMTVEFTLPQSAAVTVAIIDTEGRLVHRIPGLAAGAGLMTLSYPGLLQSLPAGRYVVTVTAGGYRGSAVILR